MKHSLLLYRRTGDRHSALTADTEQRGRQLGGTGGHSNDQAGIVHQGFASSIIIQPPA